MLDNPHHKVVNSAQRDSSIDPNSLKVAEPQLMVGISKADQNTPSLRAEISGNQMGSRKSNQKRRPNSYSEFQRQSKEGASGQVGSAN